MAIDAGGSIVVACPNYAGKGKPVAERRPAVFIKIGKSGKVTRWFECPVFEETGIARPLEEGKPCSSRTRRRSSNRSPSSVTSRAA